MPELDHDDSLLEISQEEFLAAASPSDLKGRINLRLDQLLQEEIESIAEDTAYPLKSVSEVVRFCCIDGLQRLRKWKPKTTLLGAIKTANALMMRDKLQCESIEMLTRMDERVDWYVQNGHYEEVIDLVAQVRSYFDDMPNEFWATKIRQDIDERFIQYMDRIDAIRKD